MGSPVFVVGGPRGERVEALLAGPLRSSRHPIIVLLPSEEAEFHAASVARGDWDRFDRARVRVLVGDDLQGLDHLVAPHAPARLHGATIVPGAGDASRPSIARLAACLRERYASEMRTIEEATKRYQARRAASDRSPPFRSVFAAADASTTALKHLGAELVAAARQLGMGATYHEMDLHHDPFRPLRRLEAFLEASPDLLVAFVASRAREWGALAAGTPTISYWSSDPERYRLEAQGFSGDDLVCVSDRRWMRSFTSRGIEAHHVPLATGLGAFDLEASGAEDDGPVLVVGNLPDALDVLPGSLAGKAAEVRQLAKEWCAAPGDTPLEAIAASARLLADDDANGSLRRAVEFAATRLDRIAAAVTVATLGVPLVVHGDQRWAEALMGTAAEGTWQGPLVGREAAARAFRRAALVVNTISRNAVDALNMRALDVAAVGGVLVSTHRPGLADAFAMGREAFAYRSSEELAAVVRDLHRDPTRRAAVGSAARLRVRADHSWEARWRTFLGLLEARRRRPVS